MGYEGYKIFFSKIAHTLYSFQIHITFDIIFLVFFTFSQSSELKICDLDPELKAKVKTLRFRKDKTSAAIVGKVYCLLLLHLFFAYSGIMRSVIL